MREGGLNAIFFSVYIFDKHVTGPAAVQKALDQIDAIPENVRKYGDAVVLCRTAVEFRHAHAVSRLLLRHTLRAEPFRIIHATCPTR